MRSADRGVALLEAMVAIAILASAGVILVGTVGAGLRSEREARRREVTVHAADRVLTAMTLLTRNDLDQRIGTRRVGEFLVNVQRPEPPLYRIALSESATPEVELLATVVYRESP
jgi:type II secretory pathway component PulJ